MKVSVDKKIFEKFPDISEYIIVAKGINVETAASRLIIEESKKNQALLREEISKTGLVNMAKFQRWVEIYQQVLKEADGNKSFRKSVSPTHVALAKRISKGGDLPNINPLVNYYNSFSIRHQIPVGGEDLAGYYGDVSLCFASGNETFMEIGSKSSERVNRGEVVWKDGCSVSCRMWGWRQCDRTKVTDSSRSVLFYFDIDRSLYGGAINELEQTVSEFANGLVKYFGATVETFILDQSNPEVNIDFESKEIPADGIALEEVESAMDEAAKNGNKGIRRRKPDSMGFFDSTHLENRVGKYIESLLDREDGSTVEGAKIVSRSSTASFGDFSSTLALKSSADSLEMVLEGAQEIAKEIKEKDSEALFDKVNVAKNGFINITLSDQFLVKELLEGYKQGESFGSSEVGSEKTILVESPGWNPNKSVHAGHLLNLFLGKSLLRLFEKIGLVAENDDIDNDRGVPVMQTIWAYITYGEGKTPESEGVKADQFVDRFYLIGKKEYEESEKVEKEVKEILRKWEEGDPEIRRIWQLIVEWGRTGQEETMNRVWEERGYLWHESDVYGTGKEIVKSAVGKGIIEELPDNALIARIENEYGLPDTIVLKSDGTGLYHTQDIYLTVRKKEKFNPWRIVWVVGEEQIAHFQRLFAILDALEIMPIDNLYHYAYSHVVDKTGHKISSRDGGNAGVDGLLDMMRDEVMALLKARGGVADINIAETVAIGALKYAFLSTDPFKKIKFDIEQSISFGGRSGPYIMYSYTRAKNILDKVGHLEPSGLDFQEITLEPELRSLIVKLTQFPEVILSAANNYYPSTLAEYLYDLAKIFNNFYENVNVLKSVGDKKVFMAASVSVVSCVLKDGLRILGIRVLDKM